MTRPYKKRAVEPLKLRLERQMVPLTECGCWIWDGFLDPGGYGSIRVGKKMIKAHRASWTVFKGDIPNGMMVLHTCDIRCCINPDHLFLGTQLDNMRDMARKGRSAMFCGETNNKAKLTEAQVIEMRKSVLGCAALGREYGISAATASAIKLRKNWRHL